VELSCTVEHRPDAAIVRVRGDVDIASAPKLREALLEVLAETPATHLVVDLSDVEFIDSTGIGVVVGAHKRVTANGGRLTAVVVTPAVHRVLRTTGLLSAWRVTESVQEALDG
jgi:anti-sigma B factor antagonist